MITQGKWRIGHKDGQWKDRIYTEGDESLICEMKSNVPTEQIKSNAHLIAAAPELLAACKMGLKLARMTNHPDEYHIEQAIAKAENKV